MQIAAEDSRQMQALDAAGAAGVALVRAPTFTDRQLNPDSLVLRRISGWPRHIARRAEELLMRSGRSLREASVLVVGLSPEPGGGDTRKAPAVEIIARLRSEGVHVDYHDPHVPSLRVDGEELRSVRVALRGEGPSPGRGQSVDVKGYDLAILATLHPGYDYAWVQRCPAVLDCTYCTPGGRRRFLP
jgi:UDP-N-acetyl-D-glucosamine dehydrogenase